MQDTARPWLSLAVAITVVAAYAASALASGLDRAGAIATTTAYPAIVRGGALKSQAAKAIETANSELAERLAGLAVATNPSDAQSLGLLGSAQLVKSDRDAAARTFAVAGQKGWRDFPTQLFWYDSAVRAEDWPVAARRLDAVLRVFPSLPEMNELLAAIELSGTKAEAALATRVALQSSWQRRYLDGLSGLPAAQLRARGRVVSNWQMAQVDFECAQLSPLVGALLGEGSRPDADRVWRQHCDDAGLVFPVLDSDFGFLAAEGELPGLAWQVEQSGDLDLAVSKDNGRARVSLENVGVNSALALSQRSYLASGSYRISALDDKGVALPAIQIALSCSGQKSLPQGAIVGQGSAVVSVGADCPSQVLTLWVAPDAGKQTIDRLEVTRLP